MNLSVRPWDVCTGACARVTVDLREDSDIVSGMYRTEDNLMPCSKFHLQAIEMASLRERTKAPKADSADLAERLPREKARFRRLTPLHTHQHPCTASCKPQLCICL